MQDYDNPMNDDTLKKAIDLLSSLLSQEEQPVQKSMEDLLIDWFGAEEIVKAHNPIEKEFTLVKAWNDDAGLHIEGWVSTNDTDLERDIIEPEAFAKSMASYFARSAPVSYNHRTTDDPIGHLRKGVLVRDGRVFQEAVHPTDPADFTSFPGTGTGFYARALINNPPEPVIKGNVSGFSFIGNARKYTMLPGGGRRITEISTLSETTIAPYPVNPHASFTVKETR